MAAHSSYDLPFGAQVLPDGRVRFRLWAPAEPSVAVAIADTSLMLPMTPTGAGWYETVTDQVKPGQRYRYELSDGFRVADPASRCQDPDVHDASVVVDGTAYTWRTEGWRGRPWEETVLYELHTGTFSPAGTFEGVRERLARLVTLGVTAIELMPVADFPGRRNWGYDGVLPFAPDRSYGTPDDLKTLIDEAHAQGLMVFLDVVYNHFGPEGNYLGRTAPAFFTERFKTPWGAAIDFAQAPVREFFIHNALYWLEEYRFDGLRFDAVHAIADDSDPDILTELAERVRRTVSEDRCIHLVLENDHNAARYLGRVGDEQRPRLYTAQWNDDIHHAFHVLLTGETGGYYSDYTEEPMRQLARGLAEGFIYQGDVSTFRDGERRGEPSGHLPPLAFVNFLQNHDQVGNRAFGERLSRLTTPEALQAAMATLLLAPQVPLLFMGEEWHETRPFLYFCDYQGELADAVRNGRRAEFAKFPQFADPATRDNIPDPNADSTVEQSRLSDWDAETADRAWFLFVQTLLGTRQRELVPRLVGMTAGTTRVLAVASRALAMVWGLPDGSALHLRANLSAEPAAGLPEVPPGAVLHETGVGVANGAVEGRLPPWSVLWLLTRANGGAA